MSYKKEALFGVGWITLLRFVTRVITFIRLAILGRILTPLQFGFFGIASLFLSILEIFTETGINVFLVQYKGKIDDYIDSAWVVSVLRGFLLCFLIYSTAGLVAGFFNSNGARFIIVLMSAVPLIRGFINPTIITYQKELTFNNEFKLRSTLFLVDGFVSIIVGIITRDAVAFAWGQIGSALVEVALSYILFPLWPKLRFESEKVKHVIARGWPVTFTGIFSYFADNSDNITVGKILGASTLGIYQVAYKFSTLPITEITNVINQVIFPVYSKFSDDRTRLKRAFVQVTLASGIGGFLLGSFIYIFARPIILIFMGNQWAAAIPAIQILAIYGICRTIFGSFSALFLSVGKQDFVAQMTFCRVAALVICVVPLVARFGMYGAGVAMLISILVEIPVISYFTYRTFKA